MLARLIRSPCRHVDAVSLGLLNPLIAGTAMAVSCASVVNNRPSTTVRRSRLGNRGPALDGVLSGDDTFHEAEAESLHLFDVEPGGSHVHEGATKEVFAGEGDGDGFEHPLDESSRPGGAFDVIDEDQPSFSTLR